MKKSIFFSAITAVCFSLAGFAVACEPTEEPPVSYALEITGAPTETALLSQGTITLGVECNVPNAEIVWTSTNGEVATVEDGVVTLLQEGIVKIEAKEESENLSDSVTIEIENDLPILPTGLSLTPSLSEIAWNTESVTFSYAVLPEGAEALTGGVTFSSSNEAVATVTNDGVATILQSGQTVIRAESVENAEIYGEYTLVVPEWQDTKLENDDGTFEGVAGNVSVYSAHEQGYYYGFGWSAQTTLQKSADKTKLRVTNTETEAAWSILYVKFATPIVQHGEYEISLDLEWLGVENARGFYYSIDVYDEGATELTQMLPYQGGLGVGFEAEEFFTADKKISFTATGDYEYFYLRIVDNTEMGVLNFDFTLDNVAVRKLNTYEKLGDKVGAYSNRHQEITDGDATWSLMHSTALAKGQDGKLTVTSSGGSNGANGDENWSFFFLKFDTAIEAGKTYTITFDLEWLGAAGASGFYYSVDTGAAQTQSVLPYTEISMANLFKTGASITFTAGVSCESFYLRIINNANVPFHFTLANVALTEGGASV